MEIGEREGHICSWSRGKRYLPKLQCPVKGSRCLGMYVRSRGGGLVGKEQAVALVFVWLIKSLFPVKA